MTDIAALLQRSHLALAPDALEALKAGWTLSEFVLGDVSALKGIYAYRRQRLASMKSAHAQQLAKATAELLLNLEGATTVQFCRLSGDAEHAYAIFLSVPPKEVYGCLKVVSQLDVPQDRWEELWGGAV
mgnify:CR=1 FL=1